MSLPAELTVIGPAQFRGGVDGVPDPGRRAIVVLMHLVFSGGRMSRADLSRLVWPESDAKSRSVMLYQVRQRLAKWTGAADATGPLLFDGPDAVFSPENLLVDVAAALRYEEIVRGSDVDSTTIVGAVREFVRIAGTEALLADWPAMVPELRSDFEHRRIAVLDKGIAAAHHLGHADLVAQWTRLATICRLRLPEDIPESFPLPPPAEGAGASAAPSENGASSPSAPAPFVESERRGGDDTRQTWGSSGNVGQPIGSPWVLLAALGLVSLAVWALLPRGESAPAPVRSVGRRLVRAAYVVPDRAGQGDSEATDVVSAHGDRAGWIATGFVQTKDEDVDIVTVRVGPDGKPIWERRWSGPGKDCDRAFAVATLPNGLSVVVGETFVPKGAVAGVPEGWHLLGLIYDSEGRLLESLRSKALVRNPGHAVRVGYDSNGAVWLSGTSISGGVTKFLAMRWVPGEPVREYVVGSRAGELSSMTVAPDGRAFLFGTQRNGSSLENVRDWAAVCLDPTGRMLWEKRIDGDSHGDDVSCEGTRDDAGRIRLYGPLSSKMPQGGSALLPVTATLDSETGAVIGLKRQFDVLASPLVRFCADRSRGWDISLFHEAAGDNQLQIRVNGAAGGNLVNSATLSAPAGKVILGVVGMHVTERDGRRGLLVDAAVSDSGERVANGLVSGWVPVEQTVTAAIVGTPVDSGTVLVRRSTPDAAAGQILLEGNRRRFFVWGLETQ